MLLCIQPHNITLGRKAATTAELTRTMAHDTVYAIAVPPLSAKEALNSIFCYDEASRQMPRSRANASHTRHRVQSLTLTRCATVSSLSSYSLDSPQNISPVSENSLVELEDNSKFLAQLLPCSFCNKQGASFPKCGKCDKAWCSRTCRLKGSTQHPCVQERLKGLQSVPSGK